METMSLKWVTKGGFIEGVEAFLNPYFYLIKRNANSRWDGWETRKIEYGLRIIYVTIRANYNSVTYEVKPNPYGIEQILFLKDKGWFVAGDKLELWRVYK